MQADGSYDFVLLGDNFILGKLQCLAKGDSPGMIGSQYALELQVVGQVPTLLRSASFERRQDLWVKERTLSHPPADQLSKKYEYTKRGKMLGIETTRYLAVHADTLYYFDDPEAENFLGYCSLHNTYLQWLQLKEKRFMLVISNGNQTSHFYFSSDDFWKEQRLALARNSVLLNFNEDFEVLEELGEGSFAKVYRVRQKNSGQEYAAKMISKVTANSTIIAMLVEQKRILSYLQDSNYIYQFRQFHETNEEYIILMEYLHGVDLMSFIRMQLDLSIADRKYLLTNILMGIKDCHQCQIIHRDIKPQNIIVDVHTYQMKLIDFGLSIHGQNTMGKLMSRSKCGTIGYMAPEVFQKRYNEKCDIFSFGIIAHLLLMGNNPIKGKNYEDTCLRNQAGRIAIQQNEIVENYGENCLIFLKKCLSVSIQERYTAEQALMSSFLRESSSKSSTTTDDDRLMQGSFE